MGVNALRGAVAHSENKKNKFILMLRTSHHVRICVNTERRRKKVNPNELFNINRTKKLIFAPLYGQFTIEINGGKRASRWRIQKTKRTNLFLCFAHRIMLYVYKY